MVELIDRVVELTGAPLFTNEGTRRFGTHSWRSTGVVYFSNMGIEVLNSKLLARWESVEGPRGGTNRNSGEGAEFYATTKCTNKRK